MCSSSPTRGSVGGLPRGEYLAHIVLSVLVGMVLVEVPGTIAMAKRLVPLGMLGGWRVHPRRDERDRRSLADQLARLRLLHLSPPMILRA